MTPPTDPADHEIVRLLVRHGRPAGGARANACPEPEALAGKGGAGESLTAADLAGTPADEAAIREFMGHFSLCAD